MTLKNILEQLQNSNHPVAQALHKGHNFKVIGLGFKKGMLLNEHKAHLSSKLFVLSGKVAYKQSENVKTLDQYDETEIPIDQIHSLEALEDSLCLLTQG